MKRRSFLAALGLAPVLAKLARSEEAPKVASAPAPLDSRALFQDPPAPPIRWPVVDRSVRARLVNETGREVHVGELVSVAVDRVDDRGSFYAVVEYGVPDGLAVLALEKVPSGEPGMFLLYGQGDALVA